MFKRFVKDYVIVNLVDVTCSLLPVIYSVWVYNDIELSKEVVCIYYYSSKTAPFVGKTCLIKGVVFHDA